MNYTKLVFGVAVLVSWSLLTALFLAGFSGASQKAGTSPTGNLIAPPAAAAENSVALSTLSASEIAKHNSASDCWLIMGGKVYDVTKYLPYHPGGTATITPYCGKDAAAAFSGLPHSQNAQNLLARYYLGDVGQKFSPLQSPAQTLQNDAPAATLTPANFINTSAATVPVPVSPAPTQAPSLASQVSAHNTAASCWIVVSGKIYDVTSYIPYHPGGAATITSYCGGDATAAFTGLPHSQNAASLLAQYYLGDVTATTQIPVPNTNQGTTILSPANTTYTSSAVALKYTITDAGSGVDAASCAYSFDAGPVTPLANCANATLTSLANGAHTLVLYSKDNAGNTGVSSVSFTVSAPAAPFEDDD